MKELQVSAIKEGTVIDHISPDSAFKILKILNLKGLENEVLFGNNLPSKHGKKAILKISGKFCTEEEINKIAILSPTATLNIIKDYNVVEKKQVEIPDRLYGIARCVNPNCITNNDSVTPKFDIIDKSRIHLRCCYCEKITRHVNLNVDLGNLFL
ncbi:MAG: aspartate carbamoyltransferase regulatory subunit [Candidatus Woesearchaeota archaeon]